MINWIFGKLNLLTYPRGWFVGNKSFYYYNTILLYNYNSTTIELLKF